ncbi:hypothetical protein HB904_16875 [Listeria booriae]|uniref:Uncharacterized protein n=1 Tax=Listeria booriae TaxID=1552123 RepID=A0A841YNT0_9LIST|nr:hypothetical protein [Listeria booriae]MBC1402121.1 hypothetical protein [Listeria booriae]MBC1617853.1 hypothetical protein [Listeria booriae]
MVNWALPEPEDMLLKVGVIRVSHSQKILCYRDPAGVYFHNHINMNDSTLEGMRIELPDAKKVALPNIVATNIRDFFEKNSNLNSNKGEALNRLLQRNYNLYNEESATKEQKEIFTFIQENLTEYCRVVLGDYEVEKTEMDCAVELFMDLRNDYTSPLTAVKIAGESLPIEQHIEFIKRIAGDLELVNLSEVVSDDSN